MKIGAFAVAWSNKPLEEVLDFYVEMGLEAIEIGCGNYPGDAHCNPFELTQDARKRKALLQAVSGRGLIISALSCHGNPLHPDSEIARRHHETWQATAQLAKQLEVENVIVFSGLPGGAPGDKTPNWITAPWPEDHLKALEYQWNEVAIPYWKAEARYAASKGVYACFEMHPNFLVYNPETLIKLRLAVGDKYGERICANFDPSHLFWQGINPSKAIRKLSEYGEVIRHVHAKDCRVYEWVADVYGVLDTKHYGNEAARAWIFRTVGYGHGEDVWRDIISTLRMVGYDGVLSIEHEDSLMTADEGFRKAVEFLKRVIISEPPGEITWA
ncbi:MAG: sugar phosphate isomerase/epimerase [Armatimonadetes bacterium]|nr:sugar phosphate isomerase/epimerase [Armatimonadota bacterium]